jgi:hypothetical protein
METAHLQLNRGGLNATAVERRVEADGGGSWPTPRNARTRRARAQCNLAAFTESTAATIASRREIALSCAAIANILPAGDSRL